MVRLDRLGDCGVDALPSLVKGRNDGHGLRGSQAFGLPVGKYGVRLREGECGGKEPPGLWGRRWLGGSWAVAPKASDVSPWFESVLPRYLQSRTADCAWDLGVLGLSPTVTNTDMQMPKYLCTFAYGHANYESSLLELTVTSPASARLPNVLNQTHLRHIVTFESFIVRHHRMPITIKVRLAFSWSYPPQLASASPTRLHRSRTTPNLHPCNP